MASDVTQTGARLKPPGSGVATLVSSWFPAVLVVILAAVLQVWVRPHLNDFVSKILLDIGINIVLAISLTMVNGFTGQFSMGHAAFMAVGGYSGAAIVYYGSFRIFGSAAMAGGLLSSMVDGREVALLTSGDGLFLCSILAGGVVAALCGYLVGLPSLRLKGDYLAIVSLGFGEIVRVLIQALTTDAMYDADEIAQTPWWKLPKYIGCSIGFSGLPFYTSLFWATALAGLTMLFAMRLKSSTYGRAFLSIREDEIAAEAMGIQTTKFKVRAFVIAAFFAGTAGALFAHTSGVQLNAGELGFQKSFDIIIMVVLGGLGSISGAAIAAVILTILPELLRNPEVLVYGWIPAAIFVLAAAIVAALAARVKASMAIPRMLFVIGAMLGVMAIGAVFAKHYQVDLGKYRMIFFALALIIMMIVRPQGLLSMNEVWDRSLWRGLVKYLRSLGGAA